MKFTISEAEASDNCQRVVERMARAKWITGFARVTPHTAELQLTELGKRKIKKLAKSVAPFEAFFLVGDTYKASFFDLIRVFFWLRIHALSLFWPPISYRENLALILMIAMESRKLRLGDDR